MIKKYFALSLITASMLVAAGCSDDDDDPETDPDVPPVVVPDPDLPTADITDDSSGYDVIANSADHTQLAALIAGAGLADTLDDPDSEYTVFAPTDAAFDALEATAPGTLDGMSDAEKARLLQYHVVSGTLTVTTIADAISNSEDGLTATEATLLTDTEANLTFSNPETGLTVTDSAGAAVALTEALMPAGDDASGSVFSIDAILTAPPAPEVPETPETPETPVVGGEAGPVATAIAASNTAFSDAFIASFNSTEKLDLAPADETDPWTVFAPSNAAAEGAEIEVLEHIIAGTRYTAQELIDAGTINNFNGTPITFGGTAEELTVNGFAATLVGDGTAASATYSIEGVL